MKLRNIFVASAIIAALALPACRDAVADALTDMVDAVYDKRDQLQDVVRRSVDGVNAAMDEGGSRDPGPGESEAHYMLRMYDEHDRYYRLNAALQQSQQNLLNTDLQLLLTLPKDDPRRAEIQKEFDTVSEQIKGTIADTKNHYELRQKFDAKIQRYKNATGHYPPHDCKSAPLWHIPHGASCETTASSSHTHSDGHGH